MLDYLLASLISFSGIFFGISMVSIAPEERKPGKRYFKLLENVIFIVIICLLLLYLFYYNLFSLLDIVISLFLLLSLCFAAVDAINNIKRKAIRLNKNSRIIRLKNRIKNSYSIYAALAVILYMSYKNRNLFFIRSSLVFIYGLAAGSLHAKPRNIGHNALMILKHSHFLLLSLILSFI